jgi:hypothetical protein
MQKVEIHLVDDLDGSEAAETLSFALDGRSYEIDLSEKNATKLRKALDAYVGAARKVGSARPKRSNRGTSNTREIREWAATQGFQVADRGAIPNEVREAYAAVH